MATIATLHSSDAITWLAAGPPSVSARTASTVTLTGWCSANVCSHPGIEPIGTNALDANTSGAMIGNDAACAVSGSPVVNPTIANTHVSENANASSTPMPAIVATALVWMRQP